MAGGVSDAHIIRSLQQHQLALDAHDQKLRGLGGIYLTKKDAAALYALKGDQPDLPADPLLDLSQRAVSGAPTSLTNADTLDLLDSTAFAQLALANVFTADQRINASLGVNVAPGAAGEIKTSAGIYERSRTTPMGEWIAYTPTWTNLTVGNGTLTGKYCLVGRLAFFKIELIWGTTTSIAAANVQPTFPVTAIATSSFAVGRGEAIDVSTGLSYQLHARLVSGTNMVLFVDNGTTQVALAAAVPVAWTTSDEFHLTGYFEL